MAQSKAIVEGGVVPVLPLGTRVLVRPAIMPDYMKIGKLNLAIPDSCKPKMPTTGIIVALGDLLLEEGTKLRIGDKVIFSMYAGVEVKFKEPGADDEGIYNIMNYDDVLGVLESNVDLVAGEPGHWSPPVQ